MNIKLFCLSLALVCIQHVFASELPLCFFAVLLVALRPLDLKNIFFAWLVGLSLDLSIGVHIGSNAFSFLITYFALNQLKDLVSFDSRIRLILFSIFGFSLQYLVNLFALSFVLSESFSSLAFNDIAALCLLGLPCAFLISVRR